MVNFSKTNRNICYSKKKWYPELEENVKNVPKIFVGNKIDLRDEVMVKKTGKDAPISYQAVKTNFL